MCSRGARLEHSTRARPAHAARSRSCRSAVAQAAGRGAVGRRSTSLATGGTAAATDCGARSASPRLSARCATSTLPCRTSPSAAGQPPAAHPSRCPAFDLLLHRPARPTAVTTVVGAEVAGVLSATRRSIMDVSVLFSLPLRWCRSLPGGLELKGGAQGGCGGAAGRRLTPGGSGAPPARLQRLRRRSIGRLAGFRQICSVEKSARRDALFFAL